MTDPSKPEGPARPAESVAEEDLLGARFRAVLAPLPRQLAPERDLLPEIAAQTWEREHREAEPSPILAATTTDIPAMEQSRRTGRRLRLAAAAIVLIAVSSSLTAVLVRSGDDDRMDVATTDMALSTPAGATTGGWAAYAATEAEYARAIGDLTTALAAEGERLPPETVRLIERNLRIIDEAIRQSRAALDASPGSLPLRQALMASYEKKLDFLRQAAAITAEG